MTLQDYLDENGIVFFSASELGSRTPESRDKTVEAPPPFWPNILETLKCADEIRRRLGAPVFVISAYRSPEYNEHVSGSKTSEHMTFRALDLDWHGSMDELYDTAQAVMDEAAERGLATGLGFYPTFVHIDTGATKAHLRRWGKRNG